MNLPPLSKTCLDVFSLPVVFVNFVFSLVLFSFFFFFFVRFPFMCFLFFMVDGFSWVAAFRSPDRFKTGDVMVLVATDLAARGIDITVRRRVVGR